MELEPAPDLLKRVTEADERQGRGGLLNGGDGLEGVIGVVVGVTVVGVGDGRCFGCDGDGLVEAWFDGAADWTRIR